MSAPRVSRPIRDKTNKTQQVTEIISTDSQAAKNQATAEQLRLAQMFTTDNSKGEDPEVKAKIQQVIELTGKSEDAALFALHDVGYDLNRAVEMLLESSDSQNEWHEISKKKKSQPAPKPEPVVNSKPESDKREKSKDREFEKTDSGSVPRNRRERGPPRFQRGRGRERGGSDEDRNKTDGSVDRSFDRDRGERGGRGRGRGAPGSGRGSGGSDRGRGRGGRERNFRGTRFDVNKDKGPQIDTWTNEQAEAPQKDNIGSWGDMAEDWGADEWQGTLDETTVFTASAPTDNSMFSSSMNDNDAKMFTAPPTVETQVFTASSLANSSVSPKINDSSSTFQHSGSPLQQNSMSQPTAIGHNSHGQSSHGPSSLGQRLDLGALLSKAAEVQNNPMNQQHYMTQYNKEATESIKNAVGIGSSSAGQSSPVILPPAPNDVSRSLAQSSGQSVSQQVVSPQRPKVQRTKLPPPSKIPASAVEMPGGMNFQLDVQFGNWDFPNTTADTSNTGLGFGSTISSAGSVNNYTDSSVSNSLIAEPPKPQPTGISALDSLVQANSQSPRGSGGVFQNASSSSTPPKDYSQSGMGQPSKMSSTPDNIPYPSQNDRKASPYSSQRGGPSSGAMSSNKPESSPMTFSQSSYSASYPSSSYKATLPSSSPAVSYSPPTNGLPSSNLSHPGQNQYQSGSSGYQGSSFQNQSSYSSNQGQSSLYPNTNNQSGSSYTSQDQSGSTSYSSGGGPGSGSYQSNSYQNQSGSSFPSQAYASRDSSQSAGGSSGSYPSSQSGAPYQASQSSVVTPPVSNTGYQRDSQSAGQSGYGHQGYGTPQQQPGSLTSSKLSDSLGKMSMKESALDSSQVSQYDHVSSPGSVTSASLSTTTSTTSSSLAAGSVSVSASLGLTSTAGTTSTSKTSLPVNAKGPPNLPPGVPLIQNYMTIGQPGMAPFPFPGLAQQQHMYSYEDLQLLQQRLPMPGYSYDMPLQPPTSLTSAGRDQTGGLAYSSTSTEAKLNRVDAQSPVNAQTSQPQPGTQQSTHQQAFINAALPPGYNYYYPSGVLPQGYSYPHMFPVPSVANAAHGGSTGNVQYQKPTGGYGSHAYGAGGQNQDFSKGYSGPSSAPKAAAGSMATVSSANTDLTGTGTNYAKTHTQSFEKAGFHAGTPPPFTLALPTGTQAGPMGAPTAAYGTYVPMMHQPSQILHHPLQQDTAGGTGRSSQPSSQKPAAVNKGYSTYWGAN